VVKKPKVSLSKQKGSTQYGPLVALGDFVRTTALLEPLTSRVEFSGRRSRRNPADTLVDLWLSMLTACESVAQINTKLRPDTTLARSWGRACASAEQSTVARVLDEMGTEQVAQVRQGVTCISRWIGASQRHDWSRPLMIDIDLTELPASARAEGSTKGYFQEKGGADANCAASVSLSTMKA
jgi:hypothetical protein